MNSFTTDSYSFSFLNSVWVLIGGMSCLVLKCKVNGEVELMLFAGSKGCRGICQSRPIREDRLGKE